MEYWYENDLMSKKHIKNKWGMTIQFEGLSRCNAHCTFCPVTGDMTRGRGEMSEELFHKIIKEGKEINAKHFSPFLNGEPFLDKKIFTWLDYMEKEGVTVCLFTNAALLNKEKMDRLLKYKNILHVTFSINAATSETHEKVMRLPKGSFDKVVSNVNYMIENAKFKIECGFALVEANKHESEEFKRIWGKRAHINKFINWAGYKHDDLETTGRQVPCHHLNNIYILWDGRVCLCCFDFDGKVILGDLNKQTIKEVWENSKWIRDSHANLNFDLDLCKNCNTNRKNERKVKQ